MPVANLPQLPLVCLKTADFKDTKEVTKGKNTVIGTSHIDSLCLRVAIEVFDADHGLVLLPVLVVMMLPS
jgi:hypothetical protein